MTYGDSEHVVRHKPITTIHPEVRAELERLGVDDLPWCPADGEGFSFAMLDVWNHRVVVDQNGIEDVYRLSGGKVDKEFDSWATIEILDLARARYFPTDEKPPETSPTAFEKAERLLSHLKPSNVSDTRRELLGGDNEVGLLRLAVMEGMPDYRKTTREKHEAICAALVMLRETLARTGLTHADKDAVILAAAEKLEEAL